MAIWVGTSGWNYPEWKGSFYPEKMIAGGDVAVLRGAAFPPSRSTTLSIAMPNEKALQGWTGATPERFALTLKAPQRITHFARLSNCADTTAYFLKMAATLGTEARIDLCFSCRRIFKTTW